jgi:methionyl-tRNA synthetase
MREMNVGQDCDFSHDRFVACYTADLGNDLGNLLSRAVNMLHRYCGGVVPDFDIGDGILLELRELWQTTRRHVLAEYQSFAFNVALKDLFSFIGAVNKFVEQNAPWKMAKARDQGSKRTIQTVLAATLESLRLAALLLVPVMPATAQKILAALGVSDAIAWDGLDFANHLAGKTTVDGIILFPRVELQLENDARKSYSE